MVIKKEAIATFLSLSATLVGAVYFLEDRYASASQLKQVEEKTTKRIDNLEFQVKSKIYEDQILRVEDRIYVLLDRASKFPDRRDELYRDIELLKEEKITIQKRLEKLSTSTF